MVRDAYLGEVSWRFTGILQEVPDLGNHAFQTASIRDLHDYLLPTAVPVGDYIKVPSRTLPGGELPE